MAIKSNINSNFPIENRDQPSKGFRDNFKAAKEEIESIQSKRIVVTGDAVGTAGPISNGKGAIKMKLTMADNVKFPGNGGIKLPAGDDDQRPGGDVDPGTVRYNNKMHYVEVFAYGFDEQAYGWHRMGHHNDNHHGHGHGHGHCGGGTGTLEGVVELLKGDLNNLSLYFDEDSDTGIYSPGNGHIAFVSNGIPVFGIENGQIEIYGTFDVNTFRADSFTLNGYTVDSISNDLINGESSESALVTSYSVKQYVSTRKLEDLADVSISGPQNADILHYNSANNAWENSNFDGLDIANKSALDAHLTDTSNPHEVTSEQVGLGNVLNVAQLDLSKNLSDILDPAEARTNLGITIGTDSQAWDASLDSLSDVDVSEDSVLVINDENITTVSLDKFIRTDLPAVKTSGDLTFTNDTKVNFNEYSLQQDGLYADNDFELKVDNTSVLKVNSGTSASADLEIIGKKALLIPVGRTDDRPANAEQGQVRYNEETEVLEYFNGLTWQASSELRPWKVINSDYIITKYERVLVDTTDEVVNIHLPDNPSRGDAVSVSDAAGTFYINNAIINANTNKIMGDDHTMPLDRMNISVDIVYINEVYGWRVISR